MVLLPLVSVYRRPALRSHAIHLANALGISLLIGLALYLSVRDPGKAPPDRWTILRLFMMPFCVSSFSALIKGRGFVLVFPPDPRELAVSFGACALFLLCVFTLKRLNRMPSPTQ